jgi:SAM-dependent methyltransferase
MKLKTFFRFAKIEYLWRNKRGFCPVCGKNSFFLLTQDISLMRNDGLCIRCGSGSRHRHVAKNILHAFRDRGISKLSDFSKRDDVFVFNTSSQCPIAKKMGASKNIVVSEYFDDCKPGEFNNGILCQDLEHLTFADEQFDLIVSEDVFEHVKDWRKGFLEVHRVLKKNGVHVFSIPFYFDRKTEELFTFENATRRLREPIEYHGDPIRGTIPCFVHFGYDLFDFLRGIGCEATVEISHYADDVKFATYNSYTFVAKKTF